jgi:hypothetical protein
MLSKVTAANVNTIFCYSKTPFPCAIRYLVILASRALKDAGTNVHQLVLTEAELEINNVSNYGLSK